MSKNRIILWCFALFSAFLSAACSNGDGDFRNNDRRADGDGEARTGSQLQVTKRKQVALSMA